MTLLDGGFGTMIQALGLAPGEDPTDWNVSRPDDVASVHRAYAEAGAQVIYANTFGANRVKYRGANDTRALVRGAFAAAQNGIAASGRPGIRVALDLGPTGKLLKPAGDLDGAAAYGAFAELVAAGVEAGADLVVVETMGDVRELKTAVLAAKENSNLPVWATVTLDGDGQLLTGGGVEAVAALLEGLGVEAYGFNCGLGPEPMVPHVRRLAELTSKPIIVKPNAGLPTLADGRTVFSVGPADFARQTAQLVAAGATIVGGCCGTTPEHIRAVAKAASDCGSGPEPRRVRPEGPRTVVSSGAEVVWLRPGGGTIIGERINPTGKKLLKEAFRSGDTAYVLREAVKQVDAGAAILDVNCGVPGIDESATLERTILAVEGVVTVPLQIDTADPKALARALQAANGHALVNSVNGSRQSMETVFPLVRRYGGSIVALCLDENGIPPTADGRLAIARRILEEGARFGFAKDDFVVDALTLAVSADPQAAVVTLETVRRLAEELGVNTMLGVSNVSFGLPGRPTLNAAMYALAKERGLSAAIFNPLAPTVCNDAAAFDVLLRKDPNCLRWIAHCAEEAVERPAHAASSDPVKSLTTSIEHGLREDAGRAARSWIAAGAGATEVVEKGVVPALERVGAGFETGKVYLPQLLMAADAAGAAFEAVREALARSARGVPADGRAPIVLATVRGDIHDIGKNIVRALLENYGFRVIDLGRDVPPERILSAARESGAGIVGLSALMTTTVGAMAETVALIRAELPNCRTVVGGAVVTSAYAEEIGADFYAKDAMRTVRIAEEILARTHD